MVLFIILAVAVVAMLGSFVYAFAVYALPAFAGLWVAKLAVHHGIGLVGSALIGIMFAGTVWGVGQGVFEVVRSARVRLAVAALYAAPAAFAGYEVIRGLLKPHDVGPVWLIAWSVLAGVVVACSAVARLTAPTLAGQTSPVSAQPSSSMPTGSLNSSHRRRSSRVIDRRISDRRA